MNSEVKRIEKSVDVVVGKPVAWAIYGLLVGVRCAYRALVRFRTWLRQQYIARRTSNAS
jgi:hypothetical protein